MTGPRRCDGNPATYAVVTPESGRLCPRCTGMDDSKGSQWVESRLCVLNGAAHEPLPDSNSSDSNGQSGGS
jgi:hypothetical protein